MSISIVDPAALAELSGGECLLLQALQHGRTDEGNLVLGGGAVRELALERVDLGHHLRALLWYKKPP